MTPPDKILEIIRESTGGAEWLTFGGTDARWHSVDEWQSFPNEPVVYAIGLKHGVQYEGMVSKIVYFGSTIKAKLRHRMRAYSMGGHNDRLRLLHRQFPGDIECSYHVLPGLDREWLLALEDAAMQEAFRSFGCYPICNHRALSARHREVCRGLVRILPCDGLPFSQSLDNLMCGKGVLDASQRPKNGWSKVRAETRISISINIVDGAYTGHTIEIERATPETNLPDAKADARELEDLSWFCLFKVAVWSQEKMERIVALCQQLKPAKVRGQSRVITFDAPTRSVPRPDTWGEVALLKAREIAGTFYPQTRVWLKLRFGKLLLGQAILESDYFRGEDKSDLPQTNCRHSIEMDDGWAAEVAAIPAEFPPDFPPDTMPLSQILEIESSDPLVQEYVTMRQSALDNYIHESAEYWEYARGMLLQRIRNFKACGSLDKRIESRYRAAVNRNQDTTGSAGE